MKHKEPVGWLDAEMSQAYTVDELPDASGTGFLPLYTAPPKQWVGLTDENLIECERLASIRHRKHMGSIRGQQLSPADQFLWHYARAIEAKLKEKNHG